MEITKEQKEAIEYSKNCLMKITLGIDCEFDVNILNTLLNIIKKLQKENEELKEEKEQAWEEWNNLEQGSYETEQKLKQQIKKLQKENEELKEDLKYVLNQTLGAFEKNWCIDQNFTEIREKYNLESE